MGLDNGGRRKQPEDMEVDQKVGAAMRRFRGRRTQEEVAQAIGTEQPTVSKWEKGLQPPTFRAIYMFESYLGVAHGSVYASAGLVETKDSVELAVATDKALEPEAKEFVLKAYQGARAIAQSDARTRTKSGRRGKP